MIQILFLITIFLISCTVTQPDTEHDSPPSEVQQGEPPTFAQPNIEHDSSLPMAIKKSPELQELINSNKVKIFKEQGLEVISVLGPNQSATGTYDCWMHAPFNAWRLYQGESIESFSGKEWKERVTEDIKKFKASQGIEGSIKGDSNTCLSNLAIFAAMKDSPDFLDSLETFLPQMRTLEPPNRSEYDYFVSDKDGKSWVNAYKEFENECVIGLLDNNIVVSYLGVDRFELACQEILKNSLSNIHHENTSVKKIVSDYVTDSKINQVMLDKLLRFEAYVSIMQKYEKSIARLKQGHPQIFILHLSPGPEYPFHHAVTLKIEPPNAEQIIIVNSENRHIGAIESLQKLKHIYKLPLPNELK